MVWMVFEIAGEKYVWIEEGDLLMARLKASLAGHTDGFVEAHHLDAKTAKKVPKSALRKKLSSEEAMQLLKRLG